MTTMLRKKVMAAALSLVAVAAMQTAAFADTIGYVNMEKVVQGYEKAQSIIADMKVRDAELRKMRADFAKQLEETRKNNPKNPVAVDSLEKDLSEKLKSKYNEFQDWSSAKQKEVDDAIMMVIKQVATNRKVDVVVAQQAVLQGGADLTPDVISKLNQTR